MGGAAPRRKPVFCRLLGRRPWPSGARSPLGQGPRPRQRPGSGPRWGSEPRRGSRPQRRPRQQSPLDVHGYRSAAGAFAGGISDPAVPCHFEPLNLVRTAGYAFWKPLRPLPQKNLVYRPRHPGSMHTSMLLPSKSLALIPLRLLTPAYPSVTKGAATRRGAMRKSDTGACSPARHKPTRRAPATGPVAVCTSPYISTPSPPPEDSRSWRQSFATVHRFVFALRARLQVRATLRNMRAISCTVTFDLLLCKKRRASPGKSRILGRSCFRGCHPVVDNFPQEDYC
jgi:hypothetical protein